jgi:hypothetical protein
MRRAGLLVAFFLMSYTIAAETTLPFQPFTVSYEVSWRGLAAGDSTLQLLQLGNQQYEYRSRNTARGLFKFALPASVIQTSRFMLQRGAVVPLQYRVDDGTSSQSRDIDLNFSWPLQRVSGIAEEQPVDLPLQPGTQDSLSVQIALMLALVNKQTPERFSLIDKDEIKEYRYRREGTVTLQTALGALATTIYRSERDGSSRTTRLWLAPSLHFLPVRAEQFKKDRTELVLEIKSLQRP